MALTPAAFHADLMAFRTSSHFPFEGALFPRLAWSVAFGVSAWCPTVRLTGVAVGTAGAGMVNIPTTKLVLAPNLPLAIEGLQSAGVEGPLGMALGTVIGQAIPQTISRVGQYAGRASGCGIGTDVARVISASSSGLVALLMPSLSALLGTGGAGPQLAQGLGTAIASLLLECTGTGTVIGSPSTVAGSGPTQSVLV